MRVVVDTNVLVSGLFFPDSHPGQVVRGWLSGSYEAVVSFALVTEYVEVILRPKFERFGPEVKRMRTLLGLLTLSNVVVASEQAVPSIPPVRDKKDIAVVQCALRGHADAIVTGDEDLLVLGKIDGLEVLTPQEFLNRLGQLRSTSAATPAERDNSCASDPGPSGL